MSIMDAIRRAEANDGVITLDEFDPIYQAIEAVPHQENDYLITQREFEALQQGHFQSPEIERAFYDGFLQRARSARLQEIRRNINNIPVSDRYAMLDLFAENGEGISAQDNNSSFTFSQEASRNPFRALEEGLGFALGIVLLSPIILPNLLTYAVSDARSENEWALQRMRRLLPTSPSYQLSRDIMIMDGPFQYNDATRGVQITRTPRSTRITASEVRNILEGSLRQYSRTFIDPTLSLELGGGLGASEVAGNKDLHTRARLSGNLVLSLGNHNAHHGEREYSPHYFYLSLGYDYAIGFTERLNSAHTLRAGFGWQYNGRTFAENSPPSITRMGLTASLAPELDMDITIGAQLNLLRRVSRDLYLGTNYIVEGSVIHGFRFSLGLGMQYDLF